jgi:5-hydroxyisourate hydrolase
MSAITTHVLDTARGRPADGVAIRLEFQADGGFRELARGVTDGDGRLRSLTGATIEAGTYRIVFETRAYLERIGASVFFPEVAIVFVVLDPREHFHVPLLLSPFGYATYRGS